MQFPYFPFALPWSVQLKFEISFMPSHFCAASLLFIFSSDDNCSCNFQGKALCKREFASLFHCWLNLQFPFAWSTSFCLYLYLQSSSSWKMIKQFWIPYIRGLLSLFVLLFARVWMCEMWVQCTVSVMTRTCAEFCVWYKSESGTPSERLW